MIYLENNTITQILLKRCQNLQCFGIFIGYTDIYLYILSVLLLLFHLGAVSKKKSWLGWSSMTRVSIKKKS